MLYQCWLKPRPTYWGRPPHPSPGLHSCATNWRGLGGIFQWSKRLAPWKKTLPFPCACSAQLGEGLPMLVLVQLKCTEGEAGHFSMEQAACCIKKKNPPFPLCMFGPAWRRAAQPRWCEAPLNCAGCFWQKAACKSCKWFLKCISRYIVNRFHFNLSKF